MSYFANDRSGATFNQPSPKKMAELIESLARTDSENPDVCLTHDSGWCARAFRSGLLTLENVEQGEGPQHLDELTPEAVLEIWEQLAAGRIDALQALAWLPGPGS